MRVDRPQRTHVWWVRIAASEKLFQSFGIILYRDYLFRMPCLSTAWSQLTWVHLLSTCLHSFLLCSEPCHLLSVNPSPIAGYEPKQLWLTTAVVQWLSWLIQHVVVCLPQPLGQSTSTSRSVSSVSASHDVTMSRAVATLKSYYGWFYRKEDNFKNLWLPRKAIADERPTEEIYYGW